ncbi:sugar transferase [Cellulomonas sp. 179-A 4D5 NHS]|uniref:sugar transferase n=1 Tax=Cellulomonas sp. 179-A 4D5 NHS TaxID=3142378 RepID=UPI00399F4985
MTLTAEPGLDESEWTQERRARSIEARRSWASDLPFERRPTPYNSDETTYPMRWARASVAYARTAVLLDAVLAAGVTFAVLGWSAGYTLASAAWAVAGAFAFVAFVATAKGYQRSALGDGPREFQSVLRGTVHLAGALMVLGFLLDAPVPRSLVVVGVPVLAVLSWWVRHVHRRRLHRLRTQGQAMMRTVVVGDAASALRVTRNLGGATHHGYQIEGMCLPEARPGGDVGGVPVLGAIADVVQVVADRAAEVVIVTGSSLSGDALRRLSWALGRAGAHLVVAPDIVEVASPRLTVRPTAGLSLLQVEIEAPRERLLAKSVMDRTLSVLALLVASPVILGAAAAVALTSKGGAFYRQTRVGVDGRTFTMWKLRTMVADADRVREELLESSDRDGLMFKMHADPRITPVGRVLRRFSIDELPQLLNIIKGDMSLVGPRPPLLEEVQAYPDAVRRRLRVRPGLTGLWQVSGRADLAWEESVRLDLRYVDNWSVTMDLMILWKTGRAVLSGSGAY